MKCVVFCLRHSLIHYRYISKPHAVLERSIWVSLFFVLFPSDRQMLRCSCRPVYGDWTLWRWKVWERNNVAMEMCGLLCVIRCNKNRIVKKFFSINCCLWCYDKARWGSNVYWTVHRCNSWGIKNQLDVTCCLYFTYICSTCFEH